MSKLTIEKVQAGKDGTGHNAGMFVTGSECYLHQEVIDFILTQLATIERDTAEQAIELCWLLGDTAPAVVAIHNHFNLGETP